MPSIVPRAHAGQFTAQALTDIDIAFPELVGRTCRLTGDYRNIEVPEFKVSGDIVAYCSPESTFAVTKRFFDGARKSILIGIYDFTAPHVKELVLQALARRVKVRLMLDIDSADEQSLFDELVSLGVAAVPAPSCASQHGNKVFRSSHEKVIVIDDALTFVQSGNYSTNSCPFNVKDGGDPKLKPGNRDTGLAVHSRQLAAFFTRLLSSDMDLELRAGPQAVAAAAPQAFLVEKAPTKAPSRLFASKTFSLTAPLRIQPVLSPDNYLSVVPALLEKASKSILIEQQYIRAEQPHISRLMAAMAKAKARNPGLDVRIVLGKVFSQKDLPNEKKMLQHVAATYGWKLGSNIRYINTDRLVHCHNKMVLIDGIGVLISSQNWSDAAVSENREAGLWLQHKGICQYFSAIFETDWKDAFKALPAPGPQSLEPETLREGGYVRVEPGDYAEV
jgi:phosphatidylserine/phosphatidylglycerophosphate/cardiolipin synthase-like enzyme